MQSKRLITAAELAEKHEVSIRTIYRDIKTLQASGIPILMRDGRGYSLMEGYKLPPVMFTEEEAHALLTAETILTRNKDLSLSQEYENAITKIKSVLRYNQQAKVELLQSRIQVRGNEKNEKTSNYLIKLQNAIVSFQMAKLRYHSLGGEETLRWVEPFAIYTTQDNWILIAYCRTRNDFRAFRLDRILELQVTQDTFTPHEITLDQYFESCRKKYRNP